MVVVRWWYVGIWWRYTWWRRRWWWCGGPSDGAELRVRAVVVVAVVLNKFAIDKRRIYFTNIFYQHTTFVSNPC